MVPSQQFGASMRFHSSLPPKLNEMAIIITARHWTSQYEWYAHKSAAQRAGLSQSIIETRATCELSIACRAIPESLQSKLQS